MTLSEGYRASDWAKNLAAVLSYLTRAPAFTMLKTVTPVSQPISEGSHIVIAGMAHGEQTAEPLRVQLTVDLLKEALELVERLFDSPKELFLRAIGWYATMDILIMTDSELFAQHS